MDNVAFFRTVVCDAELHIFNIWDDGDVINPLLVEPTLNGTNIPLLVGGISTCIAISKLSVVYFPRVCDDIFIVHLILRGEFVQVDPGGVNFFPCFDFCCTSIYILFYEPQLSLTTSKTCVLMRPPFSFVAISVEVYFSYSCEH